MSRTEISKRYNKLSKSEFLLFRDYIVNCCGICIPQEKDYLFETRLSGLMNDMGVKSFSELYKMLISETDSQLHQNVVDAITTNETLWFRDEAPWKYIEEIALPELVEAILSGKKNRVRIWSAAVSTGQEAYSTVMCVEEYLKKNKIVGVDLSNFEFFATDISSRVIDAAKKGSYDKHSISRGLSEYYKGKYFTKNCSVWDIAPEIRNAVRFMSFNLMNDYRVFGLFDIIFCRYVLIYFAESIQREIIIRMRDSLVDGGVLFTGNYAMHDLLNEFYELRHFNNFTYYVKK